MNEPRCRRRARAVVGGFLACRFATWLPVAEDLFGRTGTVPSAADNPFALPGVGPLLDAVFGVPIVVIALMMVLSLVHASGRWSRASALLLFVGMVLCFHRNQLTLNPSMPLLAFWLMSHAVMPPEPRHERRAGSDPDAAFWSRYRDVTWWVVGLAYTYSGLTKLASPSWRSGDAGLLILQSPLGRDHALVGWLERAPTLVQAGTYAMLTVELLMLPLALSRRARPYAFSALVALHLSLLATVNIADITLGMLAFHATQWPRRGGTRTPLDALTASRARPELPRHTPSR